MISSSSTLQPSCDCHACRMHAPKMAACCCWMLVQLAAHSWTPTVQNVALHKLTNGLSSQDKGSTKTYIAFKGCSEQPAPILDSLPISNQFTINFNWIPQHKSPGYELLILLRQLTHSRKTPHQVFIATVGSTSSPGPAVERLSGAPASKSTEAWNLARVSFRKGFGTPHPDWAALAAQLVTNCRCFTTVNSRAPTTVKPELLQHLFGRASLGCWLLSWDEN
jgi:hypothetical protein